METQVTEKKTLKIRKAPAEEAVAEEVQDSDVVMATVSRDKARPKTDGKVYLLSVILGFLSLVLFGTLMVLQAMEWSFYHQPPSAFPL